MFDRVWRVVVPFVLAACTVGTPAIAEESAEFVWKIREADFLYRSSAAIYSCDALQSRVANIMRAVGARDDVSVSVSNCESFVVAPDRSNNTTNPWGRGDASNDSGIGSGWQVQSSRLANRSSNIREQQAHVRVRALMPAAVTPQVLAELDKDKSRRALVSRLTGNPAAMYDDPVAFPAQRQEVTLSRSTIGLEPAECELLEQMSTSIFRRLDVRVIRRNFSCDRNGGSHLAPKLTVEALMWSAPGAGARLPQMPPVGNGMDDSTATAPTDAKPVEPGAVTPPG